MLRQGHVNLRLSMAIAGTCEKGKIEPRDKEKLKQEKQRDRKESPDNILWTLELLFICTWRQVHFWLPSYMDWCIILCCLNYLKEEFYHLQQKQTCLIYRTRTPNFAVIPFVTGTDTKSEPKPTPLSQRNSHTLLVRKGTMMRCFTVDILRSSFAACMLFLLQLLSNTVLKCSIWSALKAPWVYGVMEAEQNQQNCQPPAL